MLFLQNNLLYVHPIEEEQGQEFMNAIRPYLIMIFATYLYV